MTLILTEEAHKQVRGQEIPFWFKWLQSLNCFEGCLTASDLDGISVNQNALHDLVSISQKKVLVYFLFILTK